MHEVRCVTGALATWGALHLCQLEVSQVVLNCLLTHISVSCSVIADTLDAALIEIREAADIGADVVELRIDFLKDLNLYEPAPSLKRLLEGCQAAGLPAIVTFRPDWEA